jgi:hypothetical protein
MEARQCRQNETAWIGRGLGYRPLPLLDPGEALWRAVAILD